MNIKVTDYRGTHELSLEAYSEQKLDGNDYDTGALEAAARTARNNSRAIGRLLAALHEQKVLPPWQIEKVLGCYNESIEIVPE